MGATDAVHPSDQVLRAYGLGKLDDASSESVGTHLKRCTACQKRVAEVSSDSFLGRLRDGQGQPGSTGPDVSSSLAGLSMLETGADSAERPPTSSLPPGLADHPDYEVIRELGQGGMGTVYLALNRLMGRHEVLKVVSQHMMNRRGVLDRFLVEIRNAARLHHTNIVTAYSASRMGESIIFAMEHVAGLDLSKLVKSRGRVPVSNACNYVHQTALGLQHAHEMGMVHRDIKPSNLMLASQGNRAVIKVLDFGLAKVKSEGAVDGGLTHEGQMLGTPHFIAPEQIADARRADIRADIYSLGCTLYYLLTGGPPFDANSLYEILQAHHSMDALPLNLARPEVPVELAALVARMMAKEPQRRFQEPRDVAQALAPFFKKGGTSTRRSSVEISQVRPHHVAEPKAIGEVDSAANITNPPSSQHEPTARSTAELEQPAWESLINLEDKDQEPETLPAAIAQPARRLPWLWPAIAVGTFVVGMIVPAIVITIRTEKGETTITAANDQPFSGTVDGRHFDFKPSKTRPIRSSIADLSQPSGTPLRAELMPSRSNADRNGGQKLSEKQGRDVVHFEPSHKNKTVALFNGKDLAGWDNLLPSNGSSWVVTGGILDGRGGGPGNPAVLVTKKSDFINYRLRAKLRYLESGSGGWIEHRHRPASARETANGYAVSSAVWPIRNGGGAPTTSVAKLVDYLYRNRVNWDRVEAISIPVGVWYTIEMTVTENKIARSVDGRIFPDFVDADRLYPSGAIALMCTGSAIVQFQSLEIEESATTNRP